jgi:hypothetical protein
MKNWILLLLLSLTACAAEPHPPASSSTPVKGEYIYRRHLDTLFQVEPMAPVKRANYPWEVGVSGEFPKITKDFFRCKGSSLNPVHLIQKEKETIRYYDCGGSQRHSLPLRDQKEFVYPILIDLLNYLQTKTGKKVVITCGHCCPDHNTYLDHSIYNQASKHLLAAEVDFYIQGMEQQPDKVVDLILAYYTDNEKYKSEAKDYKFSRYEKLDKLNVSTAPWYNKEIFIKLYKKDEGRDLDNRHSYPYISLQVRYDFDLKEKINYTWDKAYHNFHRY